MLEGSFRRDRSSSSSGSTLGVNTVISTGSSGVKISIDPISLQLFDGTNRQAPVNDPGNDLGGGINTGRGPVALPENALTGSSQYSEQWSPDKRHGLYEVNGVISSDDELQRVRRDMNDAANGAVVNDGGKLYAMPAADRDPIAHIDATNPDIIRRSFTSSHALHDRVNAGSLKLANSRSHHFKPYTTPQIIDEKQRFEDGKLINRDLGTLPYTCLLYTSPSPRDS